MPIRRENDEELEAIDDERQKELWWWQRKPLKHRVKEARERKRREEVRSETVKELESSKVRKKYDVYGNEIDPKNNMPLNPNQLPHSTQTKELSTERVKSNIPKADDGETWTYPSPQMFYNAGKRKTPEEEDPIDEVDDIVAIHNAMNERTWNMILKQQRALHPLCEDLTLPKFLGRPGDSTPKSWFSTNVLRRPSPFDRHDWYVSRCGELVRYVIEYHFDEQANKRDERPKDLHDAEAVKSISIDPRPAIDNLSSLYDRMRLNFLSLPTETPINRPGSSGKRGAVVGVVSGESSHHHDKCPVDHNKAPASECPVKRPGNAASPPAAAAERPVDFGRDDDDPAPETPPVLDGKTSFNQVSPDFVQWAGRTIVSRCQPVRKMAEACETEDCSRKASVAMYVCTSSVLCPFEHEAYKSDVTNVEKLDGMVECADNFQTKYRMMVAAASKKD